MESALKPASDPPPLDLKRLRLKSRRDRAHKVEISSLAKTPAPGCTFSQWLDALPRFLGAESFRAVVAAVVAARRAGRHVVFGFGGHVVKTGCSPVVIDLMQRGWITAITTNGAGAIHDLELAETGATSEDVAENIHDGSFGMVHETMARMNEAARRGAEGVGLGRGVGEVLLEGKPPHLELSILAAAAKLNLPATVHVAIGADTPHMAAEADGAAIGAATMIDFRRACAVVSELGAASPGSPGGVWLNVGSAVILPEVFLKAVSVARNLGANLDAMTTANFDMIPHYRPLQNVVKRPARPGFGHSVIGQHEILLPLLRQAILEVAARP